jgi:uncharacterized protein (TIGR03000 family)
MFSAVLLMTLGGVPAQGMQEWSRTGGGIPLPPAANSPFTNALNAPPGGPASATFVPPAPPAVNVFPPAGVVIPVPAVTNPIRGPTPARLLVRLPADARLTIDGEATRSTGQMRRFISPPLAPGQTFRYTLRVEVTRDGKRQGETKEVTVRAGEESEVTLTAREARVVGK